MQYSNRVLMVVDVQQIYFEKYYDKELIIRINRRIDRAQAANERVFYIKNGGCNKENFENEFAENLHCVSDYIFYKCKPSAFENPNLRNTLIALKVDTIEIIGVDGNCCVAQTAIDAVKQGFSVSLMIDCIGRRSESIFLKTIERLESYGIKIAL